MNTTTPEGGNIRDFFPDDHILRRRTIEDLRAYGKMYVVFFTARSGSTWLTNLAASTNLLGRPDEFLNDMSLLGRTHGNINDAAWAFAEETRTPNGVVGVQLTHGHVITLCEMLQSPMHAAALFTPFYLRRRNLVAQAISTYRSVESGLFHSTDSLPETILAFDMLPYDSKGIQRWCEQIVSDEIALERAFLTMGSAPPFRFFYENLVSSPLWVIRWLYEKIFPGEPIPPIVLASALKKIGDEKSLEWESMFRAEKSLFLLDMHARRPALDSHLAS